MAKTSKSKALHVYEKERSIIKTRLTEELLVVNTYIDKTESYTAITAPESSLGTILSKQNACDIELKRFYVRKRKLMYLLNYLSDAHSVACSDCGEIIDLERLILLPKAHFCEACASKKQD